MKASKAAAKAMNHSRLMDELFKPISEKLAIIMEDDCVHIFNQAGDGLVIAYNVGFENSMVHRYEDIDDYLKMTKEELQKALDLNSI